MSRWGENDESGPSFEFAATIIRETDLAWFLDVGNSPAVDPLDVVVANLVKADDGVWMPKSLTLDNGDGTFSAPEWLCVEKGIC